MRLGSNTAPVQDGLSIDIVFFGSALEGAMPFASSQANWFSDMPPSMAWTAPAAEVVVIYGSAVEAEPPAAEPINAPSDLIAGSILLEAPAADAVLAELGDDGLSALLGGELLENAAAAPAPADTETFLLTGIDIDELLTGLETSEIVALPELFQAGHVPATETSHVGPVTIEIQDGFGLAATYILA